MKFSLSTFVEGSNQKETGRRKRRNGRNPAKEARKNEGKKHIQRSKKKVKVSRDRPRWPKGFRVD